MPSVAIFENDPNKIRFRAGDELIVAGEHGEEMFVLLEGEVDIRISGGAVERVGPGGTYGEMALIERTKRSATVVAVTDGTHVPISQKRFLYLVQNTPFFAIEVLETITRRLRRMNEAQNSES